MIFRTKTRIGRRRFKALRKKLYSHIHILSNEIGPRSFSKFSALEATSNYISSQIEQGNNKLIIQKYLCEKKCVQNLIFEKPGQTLPDEVIIIGAHYDTSEDTPGADDNATSIAAIIELIHLLKNYINHRTIRFVAFALEEPPFFGTDKMGSHIYAKSCHEKSENIIGMIALEMLGFYSDKNKSQKFPSPDMKGKIPSKGNFAAVVGNSSSRHLAKLFSEHLTEASLMNIENIIASPYLPGVNLSDHSSFWKFNYPAIMITDTGYFRNPNYHQAEDTIDTLNFKYFTKLVFSLEFAIKKLDQQN